MRIASPFNKISFKISEFSDLEKITSVSVSDIKLIIQNKGRFYGTREEIIKGKPRILHWARGENRKIQKNLANYFKSNVIWPSFIHGWVKHKNQKTNASKHINKSYVLSMDIKDFFPSITLSMIKDALISYGVEKNVAMLMADLCTIGDILPHGLDTSTYIANLVFLSTDFRIYSFCKKHKLSYTRYGDDLGISGNRILYPYLGTLIKYINQAGFSVSQKKTLLRGRNEPQIVIKTLVNDKARPQTEFISTLKKDIRMAWSSAGVKELTKKYNKNPLELKHMFWGRLIYVRQFNKKLYRKIRGLLVKASFKT